MLDVVYISVIPCLSACPINTFPEAASELGAAPDDDDVPAAASSVPDPAHAEEDEPVPPFALER